MRPHTALVSVIILGLLLEQLCLVACQPKRGGHLRIFAAATILKRSWAKRCFPRPGPMYAREVSDQRTAPSTPSQHAVHKSVGRHQCAL